MVDKPDRSCSAINGDAADNVVRGVPRVNRLQGVAVNYFVIFDVQAVGGVYLVNHLVVSFFQGVALGVVDAVF